MMRALFVLTLLLTGSNLQAQVPDTAVSRARALADAGAWQQAATLYQTIVARTPNDPAILGEAIDALEACGRWREAIPLLDRLLALAPAEARRHYQRGLFGAWAGGRDDGLGHLRRALELAPAHPEYAAALGEVLAWQPAGRAEARGLFERALARDRANARARIGLANLAAWGGEPAAALGLLDAVLAANPDDVAALTARGGALEQLGRHREAGQDFRHAIDRSPGDPYLVARLARTELALGRFAEARRLVQPLPRRVAAEVGFVQDSVRRALGGSLAVGASLVSREDQVDRRAASLELSPVPVGPVRFRLLAEPGRYADAAGSFRGEAYGGAVEWRTSRVGATLTGRHRRVGAAGAEWDGGGRVSVALSEKVRVQAGWERAPVEETRRSVAGLGGAGDGAGPVHASLAAASLAMDELPGGVAVRADFLAGGYGGRGLERNERIGGGVEVTTGIRSLGPHLRIGYAFRATSFAFNADTAFATSNARAGGYFSPRRYHIHQAVLQASHRFGTSMFAEADLRVGEEAVRARPGEPFVRRRATVLNSRVTGRLTSHLDLTAAHLYVDAFGAFRMHQVRLGLRQYF